MKKRFKTIFGKMVKMETLAIYDKRKTKYKK